MEISWDTKLLIAILVVQLLHYMRSRDTDERVHMARQQAHRETHNQWAMTHRNAVNIYRKALEEGREDKLENQDA